MLTVLIWVATIIAILVLLYILAWIAGVGYVLFLLWQENRSIKRLNARRKF